MTQSQINHFYIELIDRDNNRAVVETIYDYPTHSDANAAAVRICNTNYADQPNIVFRICER